MKSHHDSMLIAGIALRTSNADAFETIPRHWQRFAQEAVLTQIPDKLSDEVFAVYSQFENLQVLQTSGIAQLVYTLVIGARVAKVSDLPPGLAGVNVPAQWSEVFAVAHGQPQKVGEKWQEIWALQDLPRTFKADYERYQSNGQIDIVVGVR